MEEMTPQALDFEALMALTEDERNAALAAYSATLEAAAREKYDGELKNARYDAAKYKLSLDSSLFGFADRMAEIEEIAKSEIFSSLSDEDRLRTAYYLDRGKNSGKPSAEQLLSQLKDNPEAMRLCEAAIMEKLKAEGAPPLAQSSGASSVPLTPKAKPKSIEEASALAREAFGLK